MFSNRKRVKQYAKTATDTELVKFITKLVTENLTKIDQQTFVKNMNNKDAVFVRRIEHLMIVRLWVRKYIYKSGAEIFFEKIDFLSKIVPFLGLFSTGSPSAWRNFFLITNPIKFFWFLYEKKACELREKSLLYKNNRYYIIHSR